MLFKKSLNKNLYSSYVLLFPNNSRLFSTSKILNCPAPYKILTPLEKEKTKKKKNRLIYFLCRDKKKGLSNTLPLFG